MTSIPGLLSKKEFDEAIEAQPAGGKHLGHIFLRSISLDTHLVLLQVNLNMPTLTAPCMWLLQAVQIHTIIHFTHSALAQRTPNHAPFQLACNHYILGCGCR